MQIRILPPWAVEVQYSEKENPKKTDLTGWSERPTLVE
jgi:hypothetical protein